MVISEKQIEPAERTVFRKLVEPDEVLAFCPGCKTLETVPFSNEGIGRTRRFTQEGNRIFHLCGATEPCRLLRKI